MKKINKEVSDALHMLLNCSLKNAKYETQKENFKIVYDYINCLEQEKKYLDKIRKKRYENKQKYNQTHIEEIRKYNREYIRAYRKKLKEKCREGDTNE